MQSEFVARFSVGRTSNYTSPWPAWWRPLPADSVLILLGIVRFRLVPLGLTFPLVSSPLVLESGSRHSSHRHRHAETETLSHKGHCTHAHVIHHNHRTAPTLCVSVWVYIILIVMSHEKDTTLKTFVLQEKNNRIRLKDFVRLRGGRKEGGEREKEGGRHPDRETDKQAETERH